MEMKPILIIEANVIMIHQMIANLIAIMSGEVEQALIIAKSVQVAQPD